MNLRDRLQTALAKYETPLTLAVFFGSYPVIYAVNVLLGRTLGPANYGDFAVTRSVATLTATVALLGMNKASLKFLPVYRKQGAHDMAKGFIVASLLGVVAAALLLSTIGMGITQALTAHATGEVHPVRIAMLWVVPLCVGIYVVSLLEGHQQIFLSSVMDRVVLPLVTIAVVGGALLLGDVLTDMWAVILLIVARLIVVFVLLWLLWTIWRREYREVGPAYDTKNWTGAIVPFLVPALVIAALGQSSMLILEAHHPSEEAVGVYAAVQQVASLPLLALGAISTLAVPRLSVLLEDGETGAFHRQLGRFIRILAVFGVGSLLLFIVDGDFLLGLFGHDFTNGHAPLVILGAGYLIVLVGGLVQPILQIREERTIVTATMLALLALNVGLTYLLAPPYGAMGAAAAYTLSVAVIYPVQLFLLQHRAGVPYLPAILGSTGNA